VRLPPPREARATRAAVTAPRRAPDLVIMLSIDGLGASYVDD
jgi:hypothetical protein